MRHEPGAVMFDLDDTLYPLFDFIRSGFAAVARHLERTWQIDRARAFQVLMEATEEDRGRELQACAARFRLPETIVVDLVEVFRRHRPRIRLPKTSAVVLRSLRRDWRLGVVTNGFPDIQARKVAALGIDDYVDTVVYATEHGNGLGKPEPEPFLYALDELRVPARRVVFVGDDERCDVFGASRVGCLTVLVAPGRVRRPHDATAVVDSLAEVPGIVDQLLGRQERRDVA